MQRCRRLFVVAAVCTVVSIGFETTEVFGASWMRLNFNTDVTSISFITVDPKDSRTLYVGTRGGAYKSTDGGDSWKALRTANASLVATEIVVSLQQSTTLYASTGTDVLKSVDGGETWQVNGPGLSGEFASLVIDPRNDDIVYAGQACGAISCNAAVFKSVNGGASWTVSSNTLRDPACGWSVNDMVVDPTNSSKVYATTDDCSSQGGWVWRSVDGGNTWSPVRGFVTGFYSPIVIAPESPDTLYAAPLFPSGVSRSENGGATWFGVSDGLPPGFDVNSLVIDPQFPNRLYAGSYVGSPANLSRPDGFGVFRSINAGATWTPVYDGLGSPAILDLAISSSGYSTVVFAVTENGVFKMVDDVVDSPQVGDLNGDGKADILWRNGELNPRAWLMNGMTVQTSSALPTVPFGWSTSGAGDFNGDGRDDVVRRHLSGEVEVWFMDGERIASSTTVGNVWMGWTISRVGDFNGDGRDDILWRSESGDVAIWLMDGARIASFQTVASIWMGWAISGVGDFDNDGKDDILWRSESGTVAIWLMDGTNIASFHTVANIPTNWTISGVGDFNGDDRADILWRSTSGEVVTWLMDGVRIASFHTVANIWIGWSITGVADFDGDRRADILWQDASGSVVIWKMDGTRLVAYSRVSEL